METPMNGIITAAAMRALGRYDKGAEPAGALVEIGRKLDRRAS